MARTKTVYPTDEIPHLWASRVLDYARNPQDNLDFHGATIYSYGRHFPIAAFLQNQRGEEAVVLTTRTYGSTTGGHVHSVRRAIPGHYTVFNVRLPEYWAAGDELPHRDIREQYVATVLGFLNKADRAVTLTNQYLQRAKDTVEEARQYAAFFDLDWTLDLPDDFEALKARVEVRAAERAEEEAKERKLAKRREQRRRREQQKKDKATFEAWRNGEAGTHCPRSYQPTDGTVLLTLFEGEGVMSSEGAMVPLGEAKRFWKLIRKLRKANPDKAVDLSKLGRVGYYEADKLEADGTVVIGCHRMPWGELERLAAKLDLLQPA